MLTAEAGESAQKPLRTSRRMKRFDQLHESHQTEEGLVYRRDSVCVAIGVRFGARPLNGVLTGVLVQLMYLRKYFQL